MPVTKDKIAEARICLNSPHALAYTLDRTIDPPSNQELRETVTTGLRRVAELLEFLHPEVFR
jgi:hypothetical protein